MTDNPILQVNNLSKSFGGISALKDVSFSIERGDIAALIGPNGAGKTTAFHCISGFHRVNTGMICFKGKDITSLKPHEIVKKGLVLTFQHLRIFGNLTVRENILIGKHLVIRSSIFKQCFHVNSAKQEEKRVQMEVDSLLEYFQLLNLSDQLADTLPYGKQKIVALARALSLNPEFLMLDEPASGLNQEETINFAEQLKAIIREKNLTVLIIEHDMNFVSELSNRILVLDFGQLIAEGGIDEIKNNPKVMEAYLGDETFA